MMMLDKYSNTERYTLIEDFIYRDITGGVSGTMGITDEPVYCVAFYCELETGESQYPLEDILDEYCINCTDVWEKKKIGRKNFCIFEVEGEYESIKKVSGLVGKRVWNKKDGIYRHLIIE
ncbi:MAG: hypothetical protein K2J40_06420 [Ruminococcus sp.]|nr:hypothetical protein [Ruminococcus sp.]